MKKPRLLQGGNNETVTKNYEYYQDYFHNIMEKREKTNENLLFLNWNLFLDLVAGGGKC
jgi:hypothetical protein